MILFKKRIFILLVISMVLFSFISCGGDDDEPNYTTNFDLSKEWPTATPSSQGFDENRLKTAIEKANNINNIKSLLVVRNGFLVSENYFRNGAVDNLHNVRSVTKSVISVLVGIAIEKGFITSVNDLIEPYLRKAGFELSVEQKEISIHHLLSMSSGFEWEEGKEEYWFTNIQYLLDKPIVTKPGERFNYNTLSTHLLSVILTQATEKTVARFAEENLFAPLGISDYEWPVDDDNYNIGGSNLQLRARDMAKIGMLYVNKGESNAQQIVPFDWVQQSTAIQVSGGMGWTWESINKGNYGYLWWLDTGRIYGVFMARGWAGQLIYCFPSLKLVIVATSELPEFEAAQAQEIEISNFIMYDVFDAIE